MKNEVLGDATTQMDLQVLCSVKDISQKVHKPYDFISAKGPDEIQTQNRK